MRFLVSLGMLVLAGWFVYLWDGWTIGGMPIAIVGGIIGVCAVLGLCGVNVFAGGPLDRNRDPS